MRNIKNNIEFEGMKVENAVQKIIENSANRCLLLNVLLEIGNG